MEERLTYAGVVQGPRTQLQHGAAASVSVRGCPSLPRSSIPLSVFETGLLLPRSNGHRQQQEVVFVLLLSFHFHTPLLVYILGHMGGPGGLLWTFVTSASHISHFQHCLHVDGRAFS